MHGRSLGRDHPRACGEQDEVDALALIYTGSSPRVRGAGGAVPGCIEQVGIIPARAGSSRIYDDRPCVAGDHPRACGEQSLKIEFSG